MNSQTPVWGWATSAANKAQDGVDDVSYAVPNGIWLSADRAKQEAEAYAAEMGGSLVWRSFPAPTGDLVWWEATLQNPDDEPTYGSSYEIVWVWGIRPEA